SRSSNAPWSGIQCNAALEKSRSKGSPSSRSAMSASTKRRPGACGAFASIAVEESTPMVSRAPSSRCSSAVKAPVPQPRSQTRIPGFLRTSASRSQNGCSRSARKRRYWSGFQDSGMPAARSYARERTIEPADLMSIRGRGGDVQRAGRNHAAGRVAAELRIREERLVVAVAQRRDRDEEALTRGNAELLRSHERARPFDPYTPGVEVRGRRTRGND